MSSVEELKAEIKKLSAQAMQAKLAEAKTREQALLTRASIASSRVKLRERIYDDRIGKVSLVGAGMRSHPGVTAKFCEALARVGINIELISTSEIRISVLIKDFELDKAVSALHEAFGLGGDEEAVVYAGSGR